MLVKATFAAVISIFWSPAICNELRSYQVSVMEQVRHEITVEADDEYAARSDALLEARRTSGSGKPWWEPAPPTVLEHTRQAGDFAVINLTTAPTTPGPEPGKAPLAVIAAP
jgi:hypothetical protein